jgi:trypsin-like peptidase
MTVIRFGLMCMAFAVALLPVATWAAEDRTHTVSGTSALYDLDRLGDYAAQVSWRFVRNDGNKTWLCRGEGTAIFLGEGRFLTAAHVIDQNPLTDDCAEFGIADPIVEFGSAHLPAHVLRMALWADEGGLTYPEGMDLALIEVDARMIPVALRSNTPLPVCEAAPRLGTKLWVATEYGIDAARAQPRTNDDFARIDLAGRRGHSGGGVFDPVHHCLIGIISNGSVNGTNYVPNDIVRRFLGEPSAAQPVSGKLTTANQTINDSIQPVRRRKADQGQ